MDDLLEEQGVAPRLRIDRLSDLGGQIRHVERLAHHGERLRLGQFGESDTCELGVDEVRGGLDRPGGEEEQDGAARDMVREVGHEGQGAFVHPMDVLDDDNVAALVGDFREDAGDELEELLPTGPSIERPDDLALRQGKTEQGIEE